MPEPSPRRRPRLGLRFRWRVFAWPRWRVRLRTSWRRSFRWLIELIGVASIAGFAYTLYEGSALLVAGLYLVLAANRGSSDERRR